MTEEKHNRAQSAALCPSFIHHIKDVLNAKLLQAINATELQYMVLFSVKAALRRRPQRSQSTSYTSPVKWKQQTGIKAVTNQDKTFLLSSCTPWSNHLIICPLSATDCTKGLISFVQLRNFLSPEVRSILARDFT